MLLIRYNTCFAVNFYFWLANYLFCSERVEAVECPLFFSTLCVPAMQQAVMCHTGCVLMYSAAAPPNCLRLCAQWSLSSAMIKWWQPKRIIAKILLQFSFMVAFYANLFVNPDSLTDMNYMKCSRVLWVQVIGLFLKRVQNSVSPVSGWQATLVLSRHKVKKCLNMLGPLFIWSPSHTADNPVILTDVSTWIWPCLCQNLMSTYWLHFFFAWHWLSTVWGSGGASCYRSRLLINNARGAIQNITLSPNDCAHD